MAFYTVTRSNVALSTTADTFTLIPAAARKFRIHEISFSGMGTASAANEVLVSASSAGTTPATLVTPSPVDPDSVAAGFTAPTAWTTQPTLGNALLRLGVNANGGVYRWVAKPGEEIVARAGSSATPQVSIRSAVGTSNVSLHVVVEEY